MKIIRYLDSNQQVKYASLQADDTALEISGDIFGKFAVTDKPADGGQAAGAGRRRPACCASA